MFTDKVIIVTGAAGNVGSAVDTPAREPWCKGRGRRYARPTAHRGDGRRWKIPAGICRYRKSISPTQPPVKAWSRGLSHALGGLHGVATTVGGFAMGKLAETSLDQWDAMFSLNVKTTWNIYRAAAPVLKAAGGGSLVGIGSVAGLHGSSQMAPYAATKSAVLRLTESLADELRPDRIRGQRRPAHHDRYATKSCCDAQRRHHPLGETDRSCRGHALPAVRRR